MRAAFEDTGLVMMTNDPKTADILKNVSGSIGAVAPAQIATEKRRQKGLAPDGILPQPSARTDDGSRNGPAPQTGMAFHKSLYLVQTSAVSPAAQAFAAVVHPPPKGRTPWIHSITPRRRNNMKNAPLHTASSVPVPATHLATVVALIVAVLVAVLPPMLHFHFAQQFVRGVSP